MICEHDWTAWLSKASIDNDFIRVESQKEVVILDVRMCRSCGEVQWKGRVE